MVKSYDSRPNVSTLLSSVSIRVGRRNCYMKIMVYWCKGTKSLKISDLILFKPKKQVTFSAHVASRGNFRHRSEERRVGKECRSRGSPYH